MKIAYIVRNYDRLGGISGYVAALADKISQRNDVHIYTASIKDGPSNITGHIVPSLSSDFLKNRKKFAWNVALEVASFMFVSRGRLNKNEYDIIHSQGDYTGYCDVYTAHSCHKAWLDIAQKRANSLFEKFKKSKFNPLHSLLLRSERYGIERSKKIIAISERVRKELIQFYPEAADKIVTIPNGVDTARFFGENKQKYRQEIRNRYSLKDTDMVAVFPAHEFSRKGLLQIIEAFGMLKNRGLFLLVVGRDDPSPYASIIKEKELTDRIIFAGEQAEPEKFYVAADMMLFPTLYEPYGLVITEAMACCLPVIVSSVAGASELISDKVDGLLIKDRNDINEIAQKIKWVIDNRTAALEMGAKARKTAENYSWELVSSKIYDLYASIRNKKSNIKVCMFARSILAHAMGGMELHIETLSKELVKNGVDVTIITTKNPDGAEFENKSGVKIHYLKDTLPGRYGLGFYKRSAEKFVELQRTEKFDLIHSQSAGAYFILKYGINRRFNIPVVVSLHGTSVDEIRTKLRLGISFRAYLSLIKNVYNYIFRDSKYLKLCDAVIATSDSQVNTIGRYYGIVRDKLRLVYNGIDEQRFSPVAISDEAKAKYHIQPGDKVIAVVARLKKEKGIQNIISVLPAIREKVPEVKLLIGGNGEFREALELLVKKLGLGDSVIFLGGIEYEDLSEFLNCAKMFVNSTIRENGYDLVIPQSMACAKPVIASDVRSVFTVIESGRNGFIYERNRVDELRNIVLKLFEDEALHKRIGAAARATIEAKFGLREMAKRTIDVYNEILEKSK